MIISVSRLYSRPFFLRHISTNEETSKEKWSPIGVGVMIKVWDKLSSKTSGQPRVSLLVDLSIVAESCYTV